MNPRLPSHGQLSPRARIAVGLAGLVLGGLRVDHDKVPPAEVAVFRNLNGLPDKLERPAWLVMQLGTVGSAPVTALVALACGRRGLAGRLLAGGVGTWLVAKAVKRAYRRPRPARLVRSAHVRGREATGLGFVSGHAGIVTALATAAWPELSPTGRVAAATAVPLVGATRVYVGAHLPLDVLGGAALGIAVQGLVDWAVLLTDARVNASVTPRRALGPGR